jgi:hypothetical protein
MILHCIVLYYIILHYIILYYIILYYIYLTAVGLTHGGGSTHLHANSTQYTENGTDITIKRKKQNCCEPCPVFGSYTLAFALQLKKKHGKTSVRVAARTSQADTVQYKNNDQYNAQKKNSNKE